MCDLKYWCQCLSTNIKLEESAATRTSHATGLPLTAPLMEFSPFHVCELHRYTHFKRTRDLYIMLTLKFTIVTDVIKYKLYIR